MEVAVEQRRQEVTVARVAGDPEKVRAAEERLQSAEERRSSRAETWEKVVSRSYKLEGLIGVGGLMAAAWLGRMGWRRVQSGTEGRAEPDGVSSRDDS
jgi:hypothetical protein